MTDKDAVTQMCVIVTPEDLGAMGYVEDTAYLRWVQAVVIQHWERFAPPEAKLSTLWIAVKHMISFRSPGGIADRVIARTQISRLRGARATFTTIFYRGHQLLAEVESTWVALDAQTGRPKALEAHVVGAFQRLTPQP